MGDAPSLDETRHRDYSTRSAVRVKRHETGVEHDDIDDVIRSFRNYRKKKKKI